MLLACPKDSAHASGEQDKLPNDDYAIQKVLRKSIQECSQPLLPAELRTIRQRIQSPYVDEEAMPLTEAELDEAIRRGAAPRWRIIRKLAHVSVAWKMRLQVMAPRAHARLAP